MSEQIVMRDSQEAAQHRTDIKGWVSRDGVYFGDDQNSERAARYSGCTHVPCDLCGAPIPKSRVRCQDCRELTDTANYKAMPHAEWDGEAMLYSEVRDQYYSTPDDAAEDLDENQTLDDLRLVICEPNYVRPLDSDYCCDELPEDGDLPPEVEAAMEAFNQAVAGIVLSWSPGKTALSSAGREE